MIVKTNKCHFAGNIKCLELQWNRACVDDIQQQIGAENVSFQEYKFNNVIVLTTLLLHVQNIEYGKVVQH